MFEAPRPCKYRCYGIRAGRVAFLILTVMSCDSAMCCFRLHCLAIGTDQNGRHQAKTSVALSHNIGLHISIIVFAGPNKATFRFECLGDHIVNQTMLVPYLELLKLSFILSRETNQNQKMEKPKKHQTRKINLLLVDFFKDILKTTIVFLENRVLGAEIQGPLFHQGILETAMCKSSN